MNGIAPLIFVLSLRDLWNLFRGRRVTLSEREAIFIEWGKLRGSRAVSLRVEL